MMSDLELHGIPRIRPSAHKTLGTQFEPNEQKIIAKLAIFSKDASIWFSAKNRYCVDWGDGTIRTYKSGVVAQHNYNIEQLPGPMRPDGSKEVIVIITPLKGYSLTDLDFDPQAEGDQIYLSTAFWRSIEGKLPNLSQVRLSVGRTKIRHPQLKKYSVQI